MRFPRRSQRPTLSHTLSPKAEATGVLDSWHLHPGDWERSREMAAAEASMASPRAVVSGSYSYFMCILMTTKEAEHWRIEAFELWCCRKLLGAPWTARRSNRSILKEITLEGLMLKLKIQYFGHALPTLWKRPDAGKDWGQEEKGVTEEEMAGWHHWIMDMSLSRFQETVKDREAWHAAVHRFTKNQIQLSSWTTTNVHVSNSFSVCPKK